MHRLNAQRMVGLLSAAACAISAASAAHAGQTIVTATYSGIVGGYPGDPFTIDTLGAFGPIGEHLNGGTFTMTFVENDSTASKQLIQSGGFKDSLASGPMSASLKIGNQTLAFSGYGSLADINQVFPNDNLNDYAATDTISIPITQSFTYCEQLSANITLPFALPTVPDCHSYVLSGATWSTVSFPNFEGVLYIYSNFSSAPLERVDLTPNVLTVTSVDPPSSVPEPASWAMLLLGVGALATAMRAARRRERTASAA